MVVRNVEAKVRVAVLGPVLIEDRSGSLVEPAGGLAKSLIAVLALARGLALSVPSIVEDLWGDAPPRQERAALQTLVSRLRSISADGILESTPSGYALALDPAETDLGLAASLLERARRSQRDRDHRSALSDVESALALWRGEPGADLGGGPLAASLSSRAHAVRSELNRLRAACLIEMGDAKSAAAVAESLAAETPLDEELQLLLLRSLDAAGRRNDAIRAFAEFRARLSDEFGTRPGIRLVEFHAGLLQDEPAAASQAGSVRIGLRTPPNELIGRDADLQGLDELVASSRLTTLLGPGGIGKTRLAQEVARRASDRMPAVVVVELASVRRGDDVALSFASTLGIREARGTRVQAGDPGSRIDLRSRILASLSERETLLVVDNCEHLVDAAAGWVSDILDSTTNVRVLATSRAPLAIGAERVFPLEPLASSTATTARASGTPSRSGAGRPRLSSLLGAVRRTDSRPPEAPTDEEIRRHGPAVELFVQRARAARPGVVLPLDSVARLCGRLDGLPLAIELAAARTRSMSVDEIERRLENRFSLLTGGERTAPERHRTLLAVIDWSWNLLTTHQQALLRRLSRFPDGFSAGAARAVADDDAPEVIDDMDALVGQSLVSVAEDPASGILRYRMLETVREFGDIQLAKTGEERLVRDRVFSWAMTITREALLHMDGPMQLPSLRATAAEQDNLIAVLRAAFDSARPDVVVNVFAALGYFWTLRGNHSEVSSFGESVERATRGYDPDPDDLVATAGTYTLLGGTLMFTDARTSARLLSRLRTLRRTHPSMDSRLDLLADALLSFDVRHADLESIRGYCNSSDAHVACLANLLMSGFEENAGMMEDSLASAMRAYELSREVDEVWAQASAAQSVAQLYSQLAEPQEALRWAEVARIGLEQLEAIGDMLQLDWLVAINAVSLGDRARAEAILDRLARTEPETGIDFMDLRLIGFSGLAEIALAEGRVADGLRLYRAATEVFETELATITPWSSIGLAARLVASLRGETAEDPSERPAAAETDEIAGALLLRIQQSILQRANKYVDRPVLSTGVFAIATWVTLRNVESPEPDARLTAHGVELLALAARLSSRQDVPSLHRAPVELLIRGRVGDRAVDQARDAVRRMSLEEATTRMIALLTTLDDGEGLTAGP